MFNGRAVGRVEAVLHGRDPTSRARNWRLSGLARAGLYPTYDDCAKIACLRAPHGVIPAKAGTHDGSKLVFRCAKIEALQRNALSHFRCSRRCHCSTRQCSTRAWLLRRTHARRRRFPGTHSNRRTHDASKRTKAPIPACSGSSGVRPSGANHKARAPNRALAVMVTPPSR